jgi:hypothetical protein
MISDEIKRKFDAVLEKEHLSDIPATFGDADFFDEVPLYSRYNQVKFLENYGDVNGLLLELAVSYMDRVTSETHPRKRFVAITVMQDDSKEYLVPAIFVCNSHVKQKLKELRLSLSSAGSVGSQVKSLIKSSKYPTALSVLEDHTTVPGDVRVFIGYKSPPNDLVPLDEFEN